MNEFSEPDNNQVYDQIKTTGKNNIHFLCPRLYTFINVFISDLILAEELFFPVQIIETEALYQLIAHKITSSTSNTFDV